MQVCLVNFTFCPDISGSTADNCVPLDTWLNVESQAVKLFLASYASFSRSSGVEITAMCMPLSEVTAFTWTHRQNVFQMDDECYACGPCHEGAMCNSGDGLFTCLCSPECDENAHCNGHGQCVCEHGYTGDGYDCYLGEFVCC